MARIDSLLGILDRQGANELRLGVSREPEMYRFGARKRLAMAATSEETLRELLGEMFSAERESALGTEHRLETTYEAAAIGSFQVTFTARPGGGFDVVFLRATGTHTMQALSAPPAAGPVGAPGDPPPRRRDVTEALHQILAVGVAQRASDVHLLEGEPAVLRIDGRLVPLAEPIGASLASLLGSLVSDEALRLVGAGRAQDMAFNVPDLGRFRLNVYRSAEGVAAAVRLLPGRVPSLSELGLPMALDDLTALPHGLVIVCGPTGCGKSTTLAALGKESLRRRGSLLITLEDPIEYALSAERGRGLVRQRQVGRDVASFATGLRDALRENPDVLLIGEVRDQETIELALTAAETGHLVLTSLHSRSSASAVERIVDSCAESRRAQVRAQLADALRAVVSQRLVARAKGPGRVVALEVMRVTHNVASLIRDGKAQQIPNAIQSARKEGMLSLERSLADLVRSGEIALEQAQAVTNDPATLQSYLAGSSG